MAKCEMTRLASLLLVLLLLNGSLTRVTSRSIPQKRSAEVCSYLSVCGWEIYEPISRTSKQFVKTPCDCAPGTKCKPDNDNLSISAYVYRCKPEGNPVITEEVSSTEVMMVTSEGWSPQEGRP